MAYPTTFPEANHRYGAPEGMTEEQVGTLEVWQGVVEEPNIGRHHSLISCWQLTMEDLEHLAKNGGKIYLKISAYRHPVVALEARNPFE